MEARVSAISKHVVGFEDVSWFKKHKVLVLKIDSFNK